MLRIDPVQPRPMTTTSADFMVVGMASRLLAEDRHWPERVDLAGLCHPILEVGAGAGETDHLPAAHVAVASVHRVGEVTLFGVRQQLNKKLQGLDARQRDAALLKK